MMGWRTISDNDENKVTISVRTWQAQLNDTDEILAKRRFKICQSLTIMT